MAHLLLTAETLATLIARRAGPSVASVGVIVADERVVIELRGVAVPVIGRADVVVSLRAATVAVNVLRVWLRVERAGGILTPLVRAFLRPLLARLFRGAGDAVTVDSRHEVTVHLDRIRLAQGMLTDFVSVGDAAAPAGAHAAGCDFDIIAPAGALGVAA